MTAVCEDPRCGIRHALISGHIEVRDPDDEIVAHRALVHIERMDDDCVWMSLTDPDGQHVSVWFRAVRGKLRMVVE